ncbi:hypothetical protein [Halobellus sp. EA9]|uniref:hypothetical protein n=1 Tax=Halobellus sp. EA9 TaxID=3421647 RepID=UPI003EBB9DAE
MSPDVPPPELSVPEGWRLVAEDFRTPLEVSVASIETSTRIYEDVDLRERLADVTGVETTWRFAFASRLRIRPRAPPSRALTRLVTDRAESKFEDVLRNRGFDGIARADSHRIDVGDATTSATRYRARVGVGGLDLPVEAFFAVWPAERDYLLGGGAYPLSLPEPEAFDAERGREELFSLIRSIR